MAGTGMDCMPDTLSQRGKRGPRGHSESAAAKGPKATHTPSRSLPLSECQRALTALAMCTMADATMDASAESGLLYTASLRASGEEHTLSGEHTGQWHGPVTAALSLTAGAWLQCVHKCSRCH